MKKNMKTIILVIIGAVFIFMIGTSMKQFSDLKEKVNTYLEMMPSQEEVQDIYKIETVEVRGGLEKLPDGKINGALGAYVMEGNSIYMINYYLYIPDVTELQGDMTSILINQVNNGELDKLDVKLSNLEAYIIDQDNISNAIFGVYDLGDVYVYGTFYVDESLELNDDNIKLIVEDMEAFYKLIE